MSDVEVDSTILIHIQQSLDSLRYFRLMNLGFRGTWIKQEMQYKLNFNSNLKSNLMYKPVLTNKH